jgi:hypothetical protein
MPTGIGWCRSRRGRGSVQVTGLVVCVVLLIAGCSANSSPASIASAQVGATTSGGHAQIFPLRILTAGGSDADRCWED